MKINTDIVKKVLDKSIFGPMDVEFIVRKTEPSTYQRDEYFEIIIYVDLERFMPIGNNYDREYENFLYSIEDTMVFGLALLGLSDNDVLISLEYDNRDSIDKLLYQMTRKLQLKLSEEFNVPFDELVGVGFYFYGTDIDNPYIRIESNLYDLPDPIDETRAEDISRDIFYKEKSLSDEYDLDIVY